MRHLTYKVRLWITVGVLLAALVGVAAFSIRPRRCLSGSHREYLR
jgi:hypothetical protein